MSKKVGAAAIIISLLALILSGFSLYKSFQPATGGKDIQYVLYVGTNDKDTYEPFGTEEEAKQKVDEVLSKHFLGFTIQDAKGGWTNEDGHVDHEYTVVVMLSDTTPEKVHEAAEDLLKAFNQSSILIQANESQTEFYTGAN